MAYSYDLHWNGSSGPKSEAGQEYDAYYRVTTDDANDQGQKVVKWFEENVKAIGATYAYADDEDPNAVAKSITPDRDKKSLFIWVLKVHYAPRGGGGEFNFEFITEDLPLRCEDVTVTSIQHQMPVEEAIYRSGFTGDSAVRMPPGTYMMPSNSVPTPFNPGLEFEQAGLAIRIVWRLKTVDGTSLKRLMNSVNKHHCVLQHCGYSLEIDNYQARVVAHSLALRSEDGAKYWEVPIVIEVYEGVPVIEGGFGTGWRPLVVDRGVNARAAPAASGSQNLGDYDGRGGYISASDVVPGVPMERVLVDIDETPLTDPVPFDGNGQPLPVDGAIRRVLLEYQVYLKEIDFRTERWFQGVIF